jgi:type IV secretory pathway TrbD component
VLAADDLGDALVGNLHHPGDRPHRHPVAVGGADRPIAFAAQALAGTLVLCLALGVLFGKRRKACFGLWNFAFRSSDNPIVRVILAS